MRLIDADEAKAVVRRLEKKVPWSTRSVLLLLDATPTITQPAITPRPNDPLTLEELREMDGEPVWLHTFSAVQKKTKISQWAILECSSNANAIFLRAGVNSRLTKWFCNYGTTWLAYRRKPEEVTSGEERLDGK